MVKLKRQYNKSKIKTKDFLLFHGVLLASKKKEEKEKKGGGKKKKKFLRLFCQIRVARMRKISRNERF